MKMNNRLTPILLAALLLITAAAALLHLTSRDEAPDGTLLVEKDGIKIKFKTDQLTTIPVSGTIVNGKGDQISIDSTGISLLQLLTAAGVTVTKQVTVIADDEYSAVITVQELEEMGRVFLLFSEGERPHLVVFGDENSKRNVSGVIRLVVS